MKNKPIQSWMPNKLKAGYVSNNGLYYITHNLITGHHVIYFGRDHEVIYDQITKGSKIMAYNECKRIANHHLAGLVAKYPFKPEEAH